MSVGNQATQLSVNNTLTSMALALRNDCQAISNFQEFIVGLGLSGLEGLGYSPADAQTALNLASYLNTIAGVYKGTVTQGSLFNFDNALSVLWAGQ